MAEVRTMVKLKRRWAVYKCKLVESLCLDWTSGSSLKPQMI